MAVGRFGEEVMFDVMLAGLPSIPHVDLVATL